MRIANDILGMEKFLHGEVDLMVAMCFKINPKVVKWSKIDVEATRMVRY